MFLLVYEFDKGCSLILSTAPGLLIPICANNVAIESRVQYMFPLPARHVIDDWNGEKKLGQPRAPGVPFMAWQPFRKWQICAV